MTRAQWIKSVIDKQPVFDSKEAAVEAAIKANKKPGAVYEVWQEPENRGGRYVVASCEAFEVLYREKYKRILDDCMLADIERGEHIPEGKRAPLEGPHGVDSWTSNGYGLIFDGKEVEPLKTEEDEDGSECR